MSASRGRTAVRWVFAILVVAVWLGLGGYFGGLAGKLAEEVDSGSAAYLPEDAEANRAIELNRRLGETEALPAIVVYSRAGRLTADDLAAIGRDAATIRAELGDVLAQDPIGPLPAEDGRAAQLVVLFSGTDETRITPHVERLRELVNPAGGRDVHVTGPAGVLADLRDALGAIDLMLVLVTSVIILVILVLVYRSPLLPVLVLMVAGTALGVTQGVIYLLARADVLSLGSEVQGILSVLVLGAATDYALLLIARYRESLRIHANRFDAMRAALRGSAAPIAASAGTVALGLACLLISDLGLNRQLGPAGAIGIACALVAMLTFLPAVLVIFGRAVFWPRRPKVAAAGSGAAGAADAAGTAGGWARVAGWIARHPRPLWIGTALVLAAMSLGALTLKADGLATSDMIIADKVESKVGQQVLAEHFPAGTGNPVLVFAPTDRVSAVETAVRSVPNLASVQRYERATVDGLTRLDAMLSVPPDSRAAIDTVRQIRDVAREAARDPSGDEVAVGGFTAVELDFDDAARRDRIVIPILLGVVFLVVMLLLRALIAPLLLVATVVLSYLAAIGVSALVFQHVLRFPGVDSTFPLHAFVFLVALGVDYNIFLMARVREETQRFGTREGIRRGLAVTGGVITSAGVVLAATFAALAVIPLVLLVELAFTVAFGVLLDTLIVRSVLVPALCFDVGPRIWWPSRLRDVPDSAPPPEVPAAPSSAKVVLDKAVPSARAGAAHAAIRVDPVRVVPDGDGAGPRHATPAGSAESAESAESADERAGSRA